MAGVVDDDDDEDEAERPTVSFRRSKRSDSDEDADEGEGAGDAAAEDDPDLVSDAAMLTAVVAAPDALLTSPASTASQWLEPCS